MATDKIRILVEAEVKKALGNMGKIEKKTDTLKTKSGKLFSKLKAGWVALGAVLTGVLAIAFKKVIGLASDFEEQNAKFLTVFRGVEKRAKEMAKTLEASYGVSIIESRRFLGSVQDLFVPLGFAREKAAEMSFEVVKLSADLASFNNLPTEQVMLDIQSALVGNFETMKKYGVVLNEATLKQAALDNEIKLVNGRVEAQDKAFLALKLITEGSSDAIGDFGRTSGSMANQMKILSANIVNASVALGQKFAPVVTTIISTLNKWFGLSGDIDTVTTQLITTQTQYNTVVKKLSKNVGELSDAETRILKARRAQLKLDLLSQMKSINEQYEKQVLGAKSTLKGLRETVEQQKKYADSLANTIENQDKVLEIQNQSNQSIGMYVQNLKAANLVSADANEARKGLVDTQEKLSEAEGRYNTLLEQNENAVKQLAIALKDNIITRQDLLGLNEELQEAVLIRIETIDAEREAETKLAEERALIQEQEALAREQTNLDKEAKALTEKVRQQELAALRKKLLAENIVGEKELTRLSVKEMQTRLDKHKAVEKLKTDISKTFVDSFVGGFEDMKSGSKSLLVSMVKQFATMISARLAAWAVAMLVPGPSFNPIGAAAATAGAAAVKVAGNEAAARIQSSAAQGADFVTNGPQMLMVGDNPSGRERVTVEPLGQSITNNAGNTFNFYGITNLDEARNELLRTEGADAF
jgi:hypothetical protein